MGFLAAIYDPDVDTALYSFVPAGHQGSAMMSLSRDFSRRESVQAIPGMDSVLDGYGRLAGPMERRDVAFSFRVFVDDGDLDRAYDLLMAAIGPGTPVRLVYQTDQGALWYTNASNPSLQHTLTAANQWGHGGYCDFQVRWRIRPDWRPRYSEAAEVFRFSSVFHASTIFGNYGAVPITAINTPFTIDATGVAGRDLATLRDNGPVFVANGPLGGDLGFQVVNGSALVKDSSGASVATYFIFQTRLNGPSDGCTLRFDGQHFTLDGLTFYQGKPVRPFKPAYQREYFTIVPGIVNICAVVVLGNTPVIGGHITIDWWRKRG